MILHDDDMVLKRLLIIDSILFPVLKTVVLLNIFVETMIQFFLEFLMNRKLIRTSSLRQIFFSSINVLLTFDQFNASLLNIIIILSY